MKNLKVENLRLSALLASASSAFHFFPIFFLIITAESFAQNRINLNIRLKPESVKKVTDFGNNRVLTVSLQNPQNFPMTVIVRASLTNTNGLNIQNRGNFKPSNGIVVPASSSYTLSNI
jgi:hypothetical protein